MKISGFTMVRNAEKYYFPIKESIQSVLPIVDEFIVALGDGGDNTRGLIESIGSDKIRIYDRKWSTDDFVDGKVFAKETTFALAQCQGDWCIYLQADEVVHEKDLPTIVTACQAYLNENRVDGLLFKYFHFFGDYDHYLPFHGWYKHEIRVVRNRAGIFSHHDAQSFRKADNQKLNVVEIDAHIYHYGWVRPPRLMQSKKKEQASMHHGIERAEEAHRLQPDEFDYGPLGRVPRFKGTHPAVMSDFIKKLSWHQKLNYSRSGKPNRGQMKHEKWKYRVISFLENTLNGGRDFVGYTNWHLVRKA
jgi:glycosyltransferase involved in cell wall biosynthesis